MSQRRFHKFNHKKRTLTTEQLVEKFILRNSDNGYFTKVTTIPYKFNITEDRTWQLVGELLAEGQIESTHDEFSGEMKLCRTGKTYHILDLAQSRKKIPKKKFNKKRHNIRGDNIDKRNDSM